MKVRNCCEADMIGRNLLDVAASTCMDHVRWHVLVFQHGGYDNGINLKTHTFDHQRHTLETGGTGTHRDPYVEQFPGCLVPRCGAELPTPQTAATAATDYIFCDTTAASAGAVATAATAGQTRTRGHVARTEAADVAAAYALAGFYAVCVHDVPVNGCRPLTVRSPELCRRGTVVMSRQGKGQAQKYNH